MKSDTVGMPSVALQSEGWPHRRTRSRDMSGRGKREP
jgi:hypothetical protein